MVATQLQESASGTFRLRWSAASARFSLVRCRTAPECAFPSRRGAQEVWGNPPRQAAGHYGECLNWANALEQPPPPGCGVGCAGVRRSRLGVWSHGKVHSAQPVGFRMRFSVRPPPRMRFSVRRLHVCAGKEKRTLRKDAFCAGTLTEKRILDQRRHGKAHPAPHALRVTVLHPACRTLRVPRHAPLPCALLGMHCDVGDNAVDPPRSRYPTPAGYTNHHETRWYTVSTFGPARSYYV